MPARGECGLVNEHHQGCHACACACVPATPPCLTLRFRFPRLMPTSSPPRPLLGRPVKPPYGADMPNAIRASSTLAVESREPGGKRLVGELACT
jgi:hypothetical protein